MANLVMVVKEFDITDMTFNERHYPVRYISRESLITDIMNIAKIAFEKRLETFVFLDREWATHHFMKYSEYVFPYTKPRTILEILPFVYTIEDWFSAYALEQ